MRPKQSDDDRGPGVLSESAQRDLFAKMAVAMTASPGPESKVLPGGFTYLGQFVDHDMTQDNTEARFGDQVNVEELVQGRSPMLDLDSLYGLGPLDRDHRRFYQSDGLRLKVGATQKVSIDGSDQQPSIVRQNLDGFDLPRVGFGSTKRERRVALIPDVRNDENLAVAQIHLGFIRFHNAVVDHLESKVSVNLFERAREVVVKHYQWIVLHEFLPQLVDHGVLRDVLTNGRRFFEVTPNRRQVVDYTQRGPGSDYRPVYGVIADPYATMPIEFSVAAYRLGHSMVRRSYEWNSVFNSGGLTPGDLALLFRFSGTSGNLSPPPSDVANPNDGDFERLPSNWIADFRRLFDFTPHSLKNPLPGLNRAMAINTGMVDPLKELPPGSFGDPLAVVPPLHANLAFRNLVRGGMVDLATGQQMARFLRVHTEKMLTEQQILKGEGEDDSVVLKDLAKNELEALTQRTPLWFYILREAECNPDGKLGPVGSRIVAETFHRSIEASTWSIVREPSWKPTLGRRPGTFEMTDLLLTAYGYDEQQLAPV